MRPTAFTAASIDLTRVCCVRAGSPRTPNGQLWLADCEAFEHLPRNRLLTGLKLPRRHQKRRKLSEIDLPDPQKKDVGLLGVSSNETVPLLPRVGILAQRMAVTLNDHFNPKLPLPGDPAPWLRGVPQRWHSDTNRPAERFYDWLVSSEQG